MTLTSLAILVVPSSTASVASSSPAHTLSFHLGTKFPTHAQPGFHLTHTSYVDTSSLLPNTGNIAADSAKRSYTQFLTSSRRPSTCYVGTTTPATPGTSSSSMSSGTNTSLITIPAKDEAGFQDLIRSKMTPLWAHRQTIALDNGISIEVPVHDDGHWTLRLGDLKVVAASGRGTGTAGALRGVLVEVQYTASTSTLASPRPVTATVATDAEAKPNGASQHPRDNGRKTDDDLSRHESRTRDLLRTLFKGISGFDWDNVKISVRETTMTTATSDLTDSDFEAESEQPKLKSVSVIDRATGSENASGSTDSQTRGHAHIPGQTDQGQASKVLATSTSRSQSQSQSMPPDSSLVLQYMDLLRGRI